MQLSSVELSLNNWPSTYTTYLANNRSQPVDFRTQGHLCSASSLSLIVCCMHLLTIGDQFFPVVQFPSWMVYGSIPHSSCAVTACLLQLPLQSLIWLPSLFCLEKWHHCCSDRLIFLVTCLLTRNFTWTWIVGLWCHACLSHCTLDSWRLWGVHCFVLDILFCVLYVRCRAACHAGTAQSVAVGHYWWVYLPGMLVWLTGNFSI